MARFLAASRGRMKLTEIENESVNRGDDIVSNGGNAEFRQFGRVVRRRLERLVGDKDDSRARGAQKSNDFGGAVDEGVAEVDGAVEIERVAAIERREGSTGRCVCNQVLHHRCSLMSDD